MENQAHSLVALICLSNSGEQKMIKYFAISILSLLAFFSNAHEESLMDDEKRITHIIHKIKYGWENGDGKPFRMHFLDFKGARYFESGGQNVGLNDLVEHHVEPEKDALVFLSLNFSNIQVHIEGEFAWALADTAVKGEVRKSGKTFDKKGFQTFIFKKVDDDWKVLHTHSSSRDRAKQ